jgi:hypothetical protein
LGLTPAQRLNTRWKWAGLRAHLLGDVLKPHLAPALGVEPAIARRMSL